MGDVGGEALLGEQALVHRVGHVVEGRGDVVDLVVGEAADAQALRVGAGREVPGGDPAGGGGDPAQSPVGEFGGERRDRGDDGQRGQRGVDHVPVQGLQAHPVGGHVDHGGEQVPVHHRGSPHLAGVGPLLLVGGDEPLRPGPLDQIGRHCVRVRLHSGRHGAAPVERVRGVAEMAERGVLRDVRAAVPGGLVHQHADGERERGRGGGRQCRDLPPQGVRVEQVLEAHRGQRLSL